MFVAVALAVGPASGAVAETTATGVHATYDRTFGTTLAPCRIDQRSCVFSVTASSGIFLDGAGHCSEAGNLPGNLTLGCQVTLSGTVPMDGRTCSNATTTEVAFRLQSSVTSIGYVNEPVDAKLDNGALGFDDAIVDAGSRRVIAIAGAITNICRRTTPEPLPSVPWGLTGTLEYVDV